MSAEAKLVELGIASDPDFVAALEQARVPVDTSKYCLKTVKIADKLVFVSGAGPNKADGTVVTGKLGADISLEDAKAAARLVGYQHLAAVRNAVGSLDKIQCIVKALGMVNSSPDFGEQPAVVNGYSELMRDVFGEANGIGTRSAVGMGALPGGICVEVEATFMLKEAEAEEAVPPTMTIYYWDMLGRAGALVHMCEEKGHPSIKVSFIKRVTATHVIQ
jgi:enamine deaminase RidA (YjgF/YER057c/UK114 family)